MSVIRLAVCRACVRVLPAVAFRSVVGVCGSGLHLRLDVG